MPLALEQRLVPCLLHEGVLEEVGRMRRYAALVEELSLHQPRQLTLQRLLIERRDDLQQLVAKLAPQGGAPLGDFLGRSQPIQARQQRVLESDGYRKLRQRPAERIATGLPFE